MVGCRNETPKRENTKTRIHLLRRLPIPPKPTTPLLYSSTESYPAGSILPTAAPPELPLGPPRP